MRAPCRATLAGVMIFGLSGLGGDARANAPDPISDAKIHYRAGEAYYNNKDYSFALHEFTESYRLSQRGALLYNIALCAEKLGDWDEALKALRTYRETPDAQAPKEQALVAEKLKKLEVLAKQKHDDEAARVASPSAPEPQKEMARPPDLTPSTPTSGYRSYGWPVFGVGLLSLAGSLVVGLLANGKYADLQTQCGGDGKSCPAGFEAGRDSGQTLAHASDGLLAVGLAAVAVSVVLFVVPRAEQPRPIAFSPVLGPGSAALSATVSF